MPSCPVCNSFSLDEYTINACKPLPIHVSHVSKITVEVPLSFYICGNCGILFTSLLKHNEELQSIEKIKAEHISELRKTKPE